MHTDGFIIMDIIESQQKIILKSDYVLEHLEGYFHYKLCENIVGLMGVDIYARHWWPWWRDHRTPDIDIISGQVYGLH